MPTSPNNLQFSLSSEYLEKLKTLSKDRESLGLTAKRILIEALDGSSGGEGEGCINDHDLRLIALESSYQDLKNEVEALRRLF
ncbi:MAG: hypothetical protein IM504_19660 [Microcystis sp. M038S2]|jgi:hypothetical protein|uniref:hypothetical protein n=1 Tax=unclassified Microcystis TaxID=2643300 RepID=UPI001191B283|nr:MULTISPECIES: hypothetical protein [unclassified Microcystis]TRU59550.1 MAG: hypothetical protein EWV48_14630 [Microcystis aeruginosa Ma_QC_C_20070823_S13]TRU62247.1 MAG: hypothetical protein EWV56_07570 [Microcystis aeruginosa Ma_QC_C_20070823_S13D]MCA2685411.1 hypothetical protein [Microcystis sp. M046S2]MCA2706957.1 hypothetical protein [Microcystis sp. M038S2]MCA2953716.1 hypothetical protein [Microcystis sp. M112S1]